MTTSKEGDCEVFQSTQPKRAATTAGQCYDRVIRISIHAAQEGCDCTAILPSLPNLYFNPRSPRGLRPVSARMAGCFTLFQSTQPKRAATIAREKAGLTQKISIHAAQEGCDRTIRTLDCTFPVFQSTQPKRAATEELTGAVKWVEISIHAAQEGCDCW